MFLSLCTLNHTHPQYARTELIKNNQNPQFTKAIEIQYRFEEMQRLKFNVYDLDNESASLADDDFLGCLECSLGEVCVCVCVCVGVHVGVGVCICVCGWVGGWVGGWVCTCTVWLLYKTLLSVRSSIDCECRCLYQVAQWERQQRTRNNYSKTLLC